MQPEPGKIPPGVMVNYSLLKQAFERRNTCIVVCTDEEGRKYNVICSLNSNEDSQGSDSWTYAPFAIMVGSSIRPLMDSLKPPRALRGTWGWPFRKKPLDP